MDSIFDDKELMRRALERSTAMHERKDRQLAERDATIANQEKAILELHAEKQRLECELANARVLNQELLARTVVAGIIVRLGGQPASALTVGKA